MMRMPSIVLFMERIDKYYINILNIILYDKSLINTKKVNLL